MRQVWLVSTVSCMSVVVIYLIFEFKTTPAEAELLGEPLSSPTITKSPVGFSSKSTRKTSPEIIQYRNWLRKGQQAEAAGDIAEAVRCYSWALSYYGQPQLQEHMQQLSKKIRQMRNDFVRRDQLQQIATTYESSGNYRQALRVYQQLATTFAVDVSREIDLCQQLIKMQDEQARALEKAKLLLDQGLWQRAWMKYRQICATYQQWPATKLRVRQLHYGFSYAKTMAENLAQIWPVIDNLLQQNRLVQVLRYLQKLESFPTKTIASRIKQKLQRQMALVPAGSFIMGSDAYEADEQPQRTLQLDAFLIDRYEVTNKLYENFVKNTGYAMPPSWNYKWIKRKYQNHPVTTVSWTDANNYATWVGKKLPTEAQWEKAARGNDGRIYPWGNKFIANHCNSQESGLKTAVAVDRFEQGRSPFGCMNIVGNVLEWTADVYAPYPGGKAPWAPQKAYRVARGGCWYYAKENLRCSNRHAYLHNVRLASIGFRCVTDEFVD